MNSRERVARAMTHQAVDRVPVMCQLALGHYFLHSADPPSEIWFDSRTFARTLEDFRRRYRLDGVLVNLPGRPPNWRDYLAGHDRAGTEERLTWRDGLITRCPHNDNPHTFRADGGPLPRADYTRVDPADPATYRLAGYVWNIWHAPGLFDLPADADLTRSDAWPDWAFRSVQLARQASPDSSVHAEVFSPFTHLLELFGYDQALMALIDRPDVCERLLEVFTAMVGMELRRKAACDVDAILISSAFAGAGFISRDMYARFVLPYEQSLSRIAHDCGQVIYTHTCGAIGDRLDLMLETGIDGIDTLDPPPLGTVRLDEAKTRYGDRLFLKGNLDAVNEMLRADDETFRRSVLERLRIGSPGSGYILSSACSVAPAVRPERLQLLVELAEGFARDP